MLGGLTGLLGGVGSILRGANDAVNGVAEALSPGSTDGHTAIGNLIGGKGLTDDLITGLESGDLTGAVRDVYDDIVGPGSLIHNLGEGRGLGLEGLVDNVLGTADGLLGTDGGLLGGVLGGEGGLLG